MYLYLLEVEDIRGTYYKIGRSKNLQARFKSINKSFDGEARIAFSWRLSHHAKETERNLHAYCSEHNTHSTVALGNGHTEWFFLPPEKIKHIITYCTILEMLIAFFANGKNSESLPDGAWEVLHSLTPCRQVGQHLRNYIWPITHEMFCDEDCECMPTQSAAT